jgi:hypothetical protein
MNKILFFTFILFIIVILFFQQTEAMPCTYSTDDSRCANWCYNTWGASYSGYCHVSNSCVCVLTGNYDNM